MKITKAEAISKLENGFGSIYTKEEVIELITQIEETDEVKIDIDVAKLTELILNEILENDDIIDLSSAELSMEYDNTVELTNASLESHQVESSIDEGITQYLEGLREEREANTIIVNR